MATRQLACYIAVCDVPGCKVEPGEFYHWDNPEQAIEYTAEEEDWTLTVAGRLVCGASDQAHDAVRGHESPVVLRPDDCAMTVTFSA